MSHCTPSYSPHVLSLRLQFALAVVLLLALAAYLFGAQRTEELSPYHIDAARVDALRWLAQHQGPADDAPPPAPCPAEDRFCQAVAALNARQAPTGKPARRIDATLDGSEPPRLLAVTEELAKRPAQEVDRILDDSRHENEPLRANPFRLPGCLYGETDRRESARPPGGRCQQGTPLDPRLFPPGMAPVYRLLADYRQPLPGSVAGEYRGLAVGRELWLTLADDTQRRAQRTAACYTGDQENCANAWWYPPRHAAQMYEGARARSVGITVIDVDSGAIRAMAASHSPCFRAQAAGNDNTAADCPRLPDPRPRPHWLDNPASEGEMFGSIAKPQQALALLAAGNLSGDERARLPEILRRSDSEAMIDLYLCQAQRFDKRCIVRRVAALEKRLTAAGFNRCAPGRRRCRPEMTLIGSSQEAGVQTIRYRYRDGGLQAESADFEQRIYAGQALLAADGRPLVERIAGIDPAQLHACYRGGDRQRWRGCQGAALIDLIAELYGQGNARASLLGLAGGWLDLAAAAGGHRQAARPHLLAAYRGHDGRQQRIRPTAAHGIARADARAVLDALQAVAVRGTATAACRAASAVGGVLDGCRPTANGLRIAAKTGTPLFPADREKQPDPLGAWRARCAAHTAAARPLPDDCVLRPLKWFAALVTPPGGREPKTLVLVRAERNWRRDGRIDDAGDQSAEGNVAAEIGLALINALHTPRETP